VHLLHGTCEGCRERHRDGVIEVCFSDNRSRGGPACWWANGLIPRAAAGYEIIVAVTRFRPVVGRERRSTPCVPLVG